MKLIHSSKYRLRTITMSFALILATVSGIGVATSFVGTTPSSASSTSCPVGSTLQVAHGGSPNNVQCVITSTGTPVGAVKHVWLIILENKSYDEVFTGLNQNSYLWQTLPQQGALLTNYYGTGHFSMDNYISMVSGQSPSYGVQDDCSTTANMTNNNSGIITTGTVGTTTYVTGTTPGVSDTVPGRDDGACGYPGSATANPVTNPTNLVAPSGDVTSYTGAQPANANSNGDPADQFVGKHFPTGWFTSLTGESAGTQNSVAYPAQPALNEPSTPENDGPGSP